MFTDLIDKLIEKLESLELTLVPAGAGTGYTDSWSYCGDGSCRGDCVGGCDGSPRGDYGSACGDGSCRGDCVGGCLGSPAGSRW